MRIYRFNGFTLLELMVATTLLLIIISVSTSMVYRMRLVSQRLQVRQNADAAAVILHDSLHRALTAMHPCAAVWLRSGVADTAATPKVPAYVELLFMTSVSSPPERDFHAAQRMGYTDTVWARLYWSASEVGASDGVISMSTGRPARVFQIPSVNSYWGVAGADKMLMTSAEAGTSGHYIMSLFMSIPQVRRASQDESSVSVPLDDPALMLDMNKWGTGSSQDVGDYTDLIRCARPIVHNCSKFSVEVVGVDQDAAASNNGHKADGSGASMWKNAGAFVDGRSYLGQLTRPGIIRVRFTITDPDPNLAAAAEYSFSFSPANCVVPY